MAGGTVRLGQGFLAVPPYPSWPLRASSSGRYLVDAAGVPFRIHGEQHWLAAPSLSAADFQSTINVLKSQGINAITLMAICHDYEEHTGKTPGTGPQAIDGTWPFSLDTTGAAYAGTGISSPPSGGSTQATIWADMSTAVDAYFLNVDRCLNVCAAAGILVLFFPAYHGFKGFIEGWAQDKFKSGSTKCHTYGQYMGNRYKSFGNIIWMLGGDFDPGTWESTYSGLTVCEEQMAQGIRDGGATQLMAGHFPYHSGLSSDISNTSSSLAAKIGLNSCYAWNGDVTMFTFPEDGWNFSPATPVFLHDPGSSYEGSGPAESIIRQDAWWGAVSAIAGQMFGNQPDWYSGTGTFANINTSSGLLSTGHTQHQYRGNFFNAIAWWKLVPTNVASMGTIVTAGNGTDGTTSWIQAAKDPAGSLLIAYVPPSWANGTFTVDTSSMPAHILGQWFDPTNGTYQNTSGSPYAAASTLTFTPPGNNSAGQTDWVLVLQGGT